MQKGACWFCSFYICVWLVAGVFASAFTPMLSKGVYALAFFLKGLLKFLKKNYYIVTLCMMVVGPVRQCLRWRESTGVFARVVLRFKVVK